jgi:hypothetical protein
MISTVQNEGTVSTSSYSVTFKSAASLQLFAAFSRDRRRALISDFVLWIADHVLDLFLFRVIFEP